MMILEAVIPVSGYVWTIIGVVIATAVATFFITRTIFKKQLEKNPPINEKMIRVMLTQMGRKPSEKQVREIMRQMNNAK